MFFQSQNFQAMSATPAPFPGTDSHVPNKDDPLLQNGSFFGPNTHTTADETLTRPNNKGNQQPVTPVRVKRRSSETVIDTNWLPPGWVVEDRVRSSGATAGTVDKLCFRYQDVFDMGKGKGWNSTAHDITSWTSSFRNGSKKLQYAWPELRIQSYAILDMKKHFEIEVRSLLYYIDPASGRKFRSKKEVQYYLETGTLKKKGKLTENSDADTNSAGNLKGDKNKFGAKTSFALNFDSFNVPDRTEWVLVNANEDTWTPFIGGKKVPLYDKEQWDFAFASLTTSSHGNRKR
ncbi:hypothetical protein SADUNF_Sadunf09G0022800 [Salix dunnii]|uniref:MBD domain-containing protein n=1 Tax=Salix dunnii TaxID=1413687 RepID=A0A835JVD2_9ROSI|nr:hypothetical protein SADUNF_Sadunf09G0022800 [Salix dunnii]